ncbi:MAG: glycosyltransferase [Nitrospira sp.]|nr:glycosyltransferase [bacterium]MBL7048026.1 glycosyltransferase [Nitrospira sp.]
MSNLSIVITTRNRHEILQECLNAILDSKRADLIQDIIVVDDGSVDDTTEYLNQLKGDSRIITVIRNDIARGPAAARNQGIKEAKSEYTLIMGDDVILFPETIEVFHKHIEQHGSENASMLGNIIPHPEGISAFEYWSSNGGSQFAHYRITEEERFDAGDEYFYTSNIVTPTRMLRDNPFDESFYYPRYEDRELGYRLKKKYGHVIHYLEDARSYHKHKVVFKNWLLSFEHFTSAALHFSSLYPEDSELKVKMGIERALKTCRFRYSALSNAVHILNDHHRNYFDSSDRFELSWIRDVTGGSFRLLQEFYRLSFYRRHLNESQMIDPESGMAASEAMDSILDKLGDDV